ncbi:hypothetical protein B0T25DRAFT_221949 [Lasiosphaeria hispida]|uniref:C2H2-type domain-containing protein n=1 Tax=Lasiosphaeria hispida TaxID=260671 RepID=A0AAJ0MEU8_9PEZI|nr:hypothetical protein B0T25DRAFT_221949 [Lasiosphaeria hispida]
MPVGYSSEDESATVELLLPLSQLSPAMGLQAIPPLILGLEQYQHATLLEGIPLPTSTETSIDPMPTLPTIPMTVTPSRTIPSSQTPKVATSAPAFKFPCYRCTSAFTSKKDLSRHISSIHDKRIRFTCNEPGCKRSSLARGFTRKDNRDRHWRTMHGKVRCGGTHRVIAEGFHRGGAKDGSGNQVGLGRHTGEEGESIVMLTRDRAACVEKLRELECAIKELREIAFESYD